MTDDRDPLDRISTSWLGRSAKAAGTFMGVGARMGLGAMRRLVTSDERAAQLRAEQDEATAKKLVRTLGDLKGAMMKVGQMFSYMELALPESWHDVLRDLQDRSHAVDPETVAAIFQEEFQQAPEERFATWSPTPFAAASIGQVHRATSHEGDDLAVKVQYPGIRKALTADLKNGSIVGAFAGLLAGSMDTKGNVQELRDRLLEECDYEREADNQEKFAALWADDPAVRVPEIIRAHSTAHILASRFVDGLRFDAFVQQSDQATRDVAGALIHRVAFTSIYRHHMFNCDPHPGNYLFGADGSVVFLDFGCVKYFEGDFVDRWRTMIRACLERDHDAFRASVIEMGIAPKPEKFDFTVHYRIYLYLLRPWLVAGPVKFTHDYVRESFKQLIADNPNKFRMNMPPDFLFVNRLQWGLYSVLAMLGAECDWRAQALDLLYEPGEAHPEPFTEAEIAAA